MHRNTYLNSPRLLTPTLALRNELGVRIAGQLCGTEGYVESIATGLLAGIFSWCAVSGGAGKPPPPESFLGALCCYVSSAEEPFQPMNAHYGLLQTPPGNIRGKKARRLWHWERSLGVLKNWWAALPTCSG
jgi:methylenetetrahydrofolate--tRNA-(uracil-5-)-methyltransferase